MASRLKPADTARPGPPVALIYRDDLLKLSETFISSQAGALSSYRPVFVGLCRADRSASMLEGAVLLSSSHSLRARARKALYCMTGIAPLFHRSVATLNARLLHAHFAMDATHALPLIRHLGIPAIVTLHGYDVTIRDEEQRKTPLGAAFLHRRRLLWQRAAIFLCVSDFIREAALRAGFPEGKLLVHHIGIDRKKFFPVEQVREPIVLFVGRLTEKKGCDRLLHAMQQVQAAMPLVRLVVIGGGEQMSSLEALADVLQVRCSFLGPRPPIDVRHWMQRARVLCAPSITAANGDSEGLPTVVVEAHAMGLPVVAYRHAGIPEIVLDGITGLLSEEEDIDALANGMLRYLTDQSFWRMSSEAALLQVARNFDLAVQTRKLEAIYTKISEEVSARADLPVHA